MVDIVKLVKCQRESKKGVGCELYCKSAGLICMWLYGGLVVVVAVVIVNYCSCW